LPRVERGVRKRALEHFRVEERVRASAVRCCEPESLLRRSKCLMRLIIQVLLEGTPASKRHSFELRYKLESPPLWTGNRVLATNANKAKGHSVAMKDTATPVY
jgi:hypothetical protein